MYGPSEPPATALPISDGSLAFGACNRLGLLSVPTLPCFIEPGLPRRALHIPTPTVTNLQCSAVSLLPSSSSPSPLSSAFSLQRLQRDPKLPIRFILTSSMVTRTWGEVGLLFLKLPNINAPSIQLPWVFMAEYLVLLHLHLFSLLTRVFPDCPKNRRELPCFGCREN